MSEILEATKRIIAQHTEVEAKDITRDSVLEDLEIELLDLAEIIADLEDEFDVEVDLNAANAWDNLKTVGDVADQISSLVAKRS